MSEFSELKVPVSADAVVGENCEYDPLYVILEDLVRGDPENGTDPDWRGLKKNCLELWKKTRDLRVATYLCIAETQINGLSGLADGLDLIRWLLNEYWNDLYPKLDPDDDNDPLERLNILMMLSPDPGAFDDVIMFPSKLRQIKLVSGLNYTLRDVMIANGEIESETPVDMNLINAEMMAKAGQVKEKYDLIKQINETVSAMIEETNAKLTGGYSLSIVSLQKELKRFTSFYEKHVMNEENDDAESVQAEQAGVGENTSVGSVAPVAVKNSKVSIANVKASSRAEALLLLKKGMEYFQAEEPTSPVPYLIQRALRLAEMNFMDLLQDIAPDALSRGRDILGVKSEEDY
ncbi:MAG: type VI secretion system protein TssA [Alphaproteobacteria bacterium]|nr:type VI secretion system protein TssA [Alphaproteobacteria bacterium]